LQAGTAREQLTRILEPPDPEVLQVFEWCPNYTLVETVFTGGKLVPGVLRCGRPSLTVLERVRTVNIVQTTGEESGSGDGGHRQHCPSLHI
jgi:hypothetical protein